MARWFGPKKFGYGIGPRSWQGWIVTGIFLVVFVAVALVRPENFGWPHWFRPAVMTAVMVVYMVVAYLKYEPD